MRRTTGVLALLSMLVYLIAPVYPAHAATPSDDLKQIEYRYYFRGKYQQAIESLQTFLARTDLGEPAKTRAQEVLAASYVLGGAPAMGKQVFARLIKATPAYPGPDPTVFKLEVVNMYAEARSEYAAMVIKDVPPGDPSRSAPGSGDSVLAGPAGKPIYKKWWFYAGAATVLLIAGAAASGGDDAAPAPPGGTVAVGVRIQ